MISLRAIGKSLLKLEKVQGGLLTLSQAFQSSQKLPNLPNLPFYPSTFHVSSTSLTYFRSKTSVKLRFLDPRGGFRNL
jgi:hypothetical protein